MTVSQRLPAQTSGGDDKSSKDQQADEIRRKIVEVAKGEVGVSESNTRGRPYVHSEWCGFFVDWVWNKAGAHSPASNPGWVPDWPIQKKSNPLPGDAIIYGNQHIGIVVSVDGSSPGQIHTIEGNTTGGKVARGTGADGPTSISGYTEPVPGGTLAANDGGGGSGAASGLTAEQVASISKAAAFATLLEVPGLFNTKEALSLTGKKSLMNDQPLFPFIQQMCNASLRHFQSMPNGKFFAFYPDYFGGLNHRTAYWEIQDIEILDGNISLSDDALATHVYVVGDIASSDFQVTIQDKVQTGGVVTIFDAFSADFLNGLPATETPEVRERGKTKGQAPETSAKPGEIGSTTLPREKAIAFLKKYGARPHFEEAPMIRNTFFEMFLAYQRFCLMWARQFASTFEFTYMPELFPGGLVAFPDHGIKCYIEEVTHVFDYEAGFTTKATLTAPSSLENEAGSNVNIGMIRDFDLGTEPLPGATGETPFTDR